MTPLHLSVGAFLFVVGAFMLFVFWPLLVIVAFIVLMAKFHVPGGYADQHPRGIAQPPYPPAPPTIVRQPPPPPSGWREQ